MKKTTKKMVRRKVSKKSYSNHFLPIVVITVFVISLGYYGYKRLFAKNDINEVVFSQSPTLPVSLEVVPELITANEGDIFTVDINIDPSNLPVTASFVSLNFNPEILEYVKTDLSNKLPQIIMIPEIKNGAVMFALGSNTSSGLVETSKLATLTFKKLKKQATSLTFGGSSKVAVNSLQTNALGTTNKSLISNSPSQDSPINKKLNLSLKKSKNNKVLYVNWTDLSKESDFSNYTFVILEPDGKKLIRVIPSTNNYSYTLPEILSNGEYQVRLWANYDGTNPSVVEIDKITINDGKISNL